MNQKNKDFFAKIGNTRGPNPVPKEIKVTSVNGKPVTLSVKTSTPLESPQSNTAYPKDTDKAGVAATIHEALLHNKINELQAKDALEAHEQTKKVPASKPAKKD